MEFLDNQAPQNTKQYDDTNTGVIMANNQRTKETHPNCRGRSNVGGVWYWVSGWNKMSAGSNQRFVSLSYTPMSQEEVEKYVNKNSAPAQSAPPAQGQQQQQMQQQQQPVSQPVTPVDINEEVPF